MTEKLSECCGAEAVLLIGNKTYGWACSSCDKPCTIASKPDASPDRLLTSFKEQYDPHMEHDSAISFYEGQISGAKEQYPLAFEAGRKQGMRELASIAHSAIEYVGSANYDERIKTAHDRIEAKLKDLVL